MAATDAIKFSTSNYDLTTDGSGNLTWRGNPIAGSSGPVTSITGTANQVIASAATGAVTLSLPQSIAAASTPTFAGLTLSGLTASTVPYTDSGKAFASSAVTPTELGYVSGVTSSIQTQLTARKVIATGNAYKFETTDASGNLQETTVTALKAVATDANGLPTASTTTATELGYVSGVTSAIQTQLDSKATDSLVVHLAGTETITGTKHFTANPDIILASAQLTLRGTLSSSTGVVYVQNDLSNGPQLYSFGSTSAFTIDGHAMANLGALASDKSLVVYTASAASFISLGINAAEQVLIDSTGMTLTNPLAVASGGTGAGTHTAYAVLCGGTTSTAALQSVAGVGSSGQVLTSNGPSTLPTFQTLVGTGTVNSGTAGRLSLYAASTNAVADTYVQNSQNITIAIATQASRSAGLALTIPNPGNAVTAADFVLTEGAKTINGVATFGSGLIGPAGAVGGVSFGVGSATNGIYLSSANNMGFVTNGIERWIIDNNGNFSANGHGGVVWAGPSGSVSFPDYSFFGDTNSGFRSTGADAIALTTGATDALTINSSQQVSIPNTKFQIGGNQAFPVVQIVTATSTTNFSTTSSTFQTTNLSAAITPKFNTSKIIIIANGNIKCENTLTTARATIFRGSTNLAGGTSDSLSALGTPSGTLIGPGSLTFYDSPATTSSTTYAIKLQSSDNTNTVDFGITGTQSIILIEVAQ